MKKSKLIAIAALALTLVSCSDPAFQQYVNNRQAAINGMPNGYAKYQAQQQLDATIYADAQRQQTQAASAAVVGLSAIAAGLSTWPLW